MKDDDTLQEIVASAQQMRNAFARGGDVTADDMFDVWQQIAELASILAIRLRARSKAEE